MWTRDGGDLNEKLFDTQRELAAVRARLADRVREQARDREELEEVRRRERQRATTP